MASNAVTTRPRAEVMHGESDNPLVKFRGQLEQRANEFKMVLPAHISPERFQRTILTAVQSDPDLLRADRQSLVLACMKAAQDGLLPDKREAALVVFKENKKVDGQWVSKLAVQYMPMVYGLRKKILQSDEVIDITAKVVYRREVEEGHFIYEEGTEAMLRHKPMLDLSEADATDQNIVAAYSMATYANGTKSYEVMRRFEIDKVRECSQTGATRDRQGRPRSPSGPWVDWYPEQAKKTVMRRHSKTLPMSGDVIDVEATDDALYARSSQQLLESVDPDEPQHVATLPGREDDQERSEGSGDVPHDRETGEVKESEPEPKQRRQRAPKAEPQPEPEEQPEPTGIERTDGQPGYDLNADAVIAAGDAGDWDTFLAEFEEEVDRCQTAMDVNSYFARCKEETLVRAPESVLNRAEELRQAAIDAIKEAARR